MTTRTPNMDCLLCQDRKATATNSHFIPVGFTKETFGKRGYEEIHRISDDSSSQPAVLYGQSNLKGLDTDQPSLKMTHFVSMDHIFCQVCEKSLGRFEYRVLQELASKLFEPKFSANFRVEKRSYGVLKTPLRIIPYDFDVFFISVIWRMNLQYRFENGLDAVENPQISERLRKFLNEALNGNEAQSFNWLKDFRYVILTTEHLDDATRDYVAPLVWLQLPYAFAMGKYLCIFNYEKSLDRIPASLGIDTLPLDESAINYYDKKERVIVQISTEQWEKYRREIVDKVAQSFVETRSIHLGHLLNISPAQANQLIRSRADKLQRESAIQMNYGTYYHKAFEQLISEKKEP